MCLDNIQTYLGDNIKGWKVFSRNDEGKLFPAFEYTLNAQEYKVGVEINVNPWDDRYFYVLKNELDALEVISDGKKIWTVRDNLIALPVTMNHVVYKGMLCDGNGRGYVSFMCKKLIILASKESKQ